MSNSRVSRRGFLNASAAAAGAASPGLAAAQAVGVKAADHAVRRRDDERFWRHVKIVLSPLWVALLVCAPARADDDELTRPSLRGLKAVAVSVPFRAKPGTVEIDEDIIRTDVELELRKAGIQIAPADTVLKLEGAFLRVAVVVVRLEGAPGSLYAFHVSAELEQPARLVRAPSVIAPLAVTWSAGKTGLVGSDRVRSIRDAVGDITDSFANAYLSVNPR